VIAPRCSKCTRPILEGDLGLLADFTLRHKCGQWIRVRTDATGQLLGPLEVSAPTSVTA